MSGPSAFVKTLLSRFGPLPNQRLYAACVLLNKPRITPSTLRIREGCPRPAHETKLIQSMRYMKKILKHLELAGQVHKLTMHKVRRMCRDAGVPDGTFNALDARPLVDSEHVWITNEAMTTLREVTNRLNPTLDSPLPPSPWIAKSAGQKRDRKVKAKQKKRWDFEQISTYQ